MADTNQTAAATPATPAKKKRVVNRTQKPVFAVVSYKDENGNAVRLAKANLEIVIEKDMEKIVELLESGDGSGTVVKLNMPAPKPRAAATPAA